MFVDQQDMEEETLADLMDEFREVNKIHSLEGDRGVEGLEKVVKALGYNDTGFRFGTPVESFLSDNPGAIESLLTWIEEQDLPEWRESIEAHLPAKE